MFLNKNKMIVRLFLWFSVAIWLATSISACNSPTRRASTSASVSPTRTVLPLNTFTATLKPSYTHPPQISSTATPSPKKDPTASPTKTRLLATSTQKPIILATKTLKPKPTETPSPVPPALFDPKQVNTFTPVPQSVCPATNPDLVFDIQEALTASGNESPNAHFTQYVLDYLNAGGSVQAISSEINQNSNQIDSRFQAKDVTGDGIPELISAYGIWIDVFGCQNAQYQRTGLMTAGNEAGSYIIAVTDINLDGLAEIVAYFNSCMNYRCPFISISEWNGKEFQELILDSTSADGCSYLHVAPFGVKVQDIDSNGTKEIVLFINGNPWPDIDFPYRQETRTCMWNGKNFVVYDDEFDPPYYRFQAVQDGDRAFLAGKYTQALDFYQQAIFSDKLEWFTRERWRHDFEVYRAGFFPSHNEPTPTTDPSMVPDPNEYPYLAAYSRYRIMLLFVAQDFLKDAETVYDTLLEKFPPESPGNIFVQMASAFWNEYQSSQSIGQACSQAIAYAADHSDILGYLGDWDRGAQSLHYTPEDICPLK
jgi:hypothetical protein